MNIVKFMAASAKEISRIKKTLPTVSCRAKKGNIQLTTCKYNSKGISTIAPLSDWMPIANWLGYLRSIEGGLK